MGRPDPRTGKACRVAASIRLTGAEFWSFQPVRDSAAAGGEGRRLAAQPRSIASSWPSSKTKGLRPVPAGRPAHADPPGHLRPDRPAADAGGDRRLPRRRLAGRLRQGRRPPAGLAGLRRALGPALARRGPLRRHRRRQLRLPDPADVPYRNWVIDAVQPRHALRPVRPRAARRRPAAQRRRGRTGTSKLIATGYLAIARRFGSYEDARYPWHLTIEDTIDNLGRTFLGLTINCARCHDHKFDPITQRGLLRPVRHLPEHALPVAGHRAGQGASATSCRWRRRSRSRRSTRSASRSWPSFDAEIKQLEAEKTAADKALKAAEKATRRTQGADRRRTSASQADEAIKAAQGTRGVRQAAAAVRDGLRRRRGQDRGQAEGRQRLRADQGRPGAARRGSAAPLPDRPRRPDAAGRTSRAAAGCELAELDRRPGQPADGPRDGQPHLAASLRPGPRADAERLRQAGPAADASRAARLPGARGSSTAAGRSRRCTG